jgi:hypothetical protein
MGAEQYTFDEEPIPGAMPERWETAIEDAAQVIALGLDRAQDLADLLNDFNHNHPSLAKAIAAALAGAFVGSFIAGRRRPPTLAERGRATAKDAVAVAQSLAVQLAEETPAQASRWFARMPRVDRDAIAERLPRVDRDAIVERLPRVDRDAIADRLPRVDREAIAGRLPHVDRKAIRERVRGIDREAIVRRVAHVNGAMQKRGSNGVDLSKARYAAQLLPVAITLLKNPLVRQLIVKSAMRATRRRG